MDETIKNFGEQLAWSPVMENRDRWQKSDKFIVCGMGGSALAAGLLRVAQPQLDLLVHRDYGLPRVPEYFLRESLIILSSYSGNTAETLDTGREALEMGLKLAVVTSGGPSAGLGVNKLLDWARQNGIPHIVLPAGLQPRMALGYALKALGALLGDEQMLAMLSTTTLTATSLEAPGEALASKLGSRIPVIYSSAVNFPLAYHWKIIFNETAKIPAFANAFPELNHNEMQSFDAVEETKDLVDKFAFIFLVDEHDDPRISKRFSVLKKLYSERGLEVEEINLTGATVWTKVFQSLILASWTAYYLAQKYQRDPNTVPMIEEFKKLVG